MFSRSTAATAAADAASAAAVCNSAKMAAGENVHKACADIHVTTAKRVSVDFINQKQNPPSIPQRTTIDATAYAESHNIPWE